MTKKSLFLIALAALQAAPVRAARLLPLFNGSLMGGASWFEGARSAFRGNFRGEFVPVVEFNEKLSLLPVIKGAYSGHKSAAQVIDEGTLLTQQQEYEGELSLIYRLTPAWKIVTGGGASAVFYKETTDEGWGDGLYDNRSGFAHFQLERKWDAARRPTLLRGGLEISRTDFPNYSSLASQQSLPLQGENVLNVNGLAVFLKGETSWNPAFYVRYGLDLAHNQYTDQKVASDIGSNSDDKRFDDYAKLYGRFTWSLKPRPLGKRALKTDIALETAFRSRTSNQNFLDSDRLAFFENYYNYGEFTLAPSVHFALDPSQTAWTLGVDMTRRSYSDRPAQDSLGDYLSEKLNSTSVTLFTQVTHPLTRHLRAALTGQWQRVSSNNDFESFYKYNYTAASAMAGLLAEF